MAIQTSNAASLANPQPPNTLRVADLPQTNHTQTLPLDVIAEIIAYLDAADLSRLCRTNKVLNYMALPQLYKETTLTRRIIKNQKDSAVSPFLTALTTLASGNVGPLVKNLVLEEGYRLMDQYFNWRLYRNNYYALLGNPLLKLPAGAAVVRCTNLQSYTWGLDTVINPIVYRALGQLQHLQSLHIRYCWRDPHGHFEVPPLPRLRELTVENYFPQVYRHDFSAVLLHGTRLEVLNLHFHLLEELEVEAHMVELFDPLRKARRKLRLKSFSLHRGGGGWSGNTLCEAIDVQSLTELSFVKSGSHLSRWLMLTGQKSCLKSIQYDHLDLGYAHFLGHIIGLERMYLLDSLPYVPHWPSAERVAAESELRDMFLNAIVTNHGATLRHLMLPANWPLPTSWIAKLFRTCPNITQLSLAMECGILEGMSTLVPFLRKLWAIRVREFMVGGDVEDYEDMMKDLAEHLDFPELRYIGLGELVWEFGRIYEKDGMRERRMKRISGKDVKDVEIWKMGGTGHFFGNRGAILCQTCRETSR